MASTLELKRIIALRERENKMLRDDLLETKNWIDMKMNQQITLHDQMVDNHRQMLNKCKAYKKDLDQANLENDRYKCIAQSLASEVEELTGNKIEKRPVNSYEDEYNDVEVSEKRVSIQRYLNICYTRSVGKILVESAADWFYIERTSPFHNRLQLLHYSIY